MTVQDLPEWLIEYLEDNTGYEHKGIWIHDKQYPTFTEQSEAVVEFYEFISKPENAAKLECVKPLLEALAFYSLDRNWLQRTETVDLSKTSAVFKKEYVEKHGFEENIIETKVWRPSARLQVTRNKLAEDALKPFKKEGSDV